METAKDMIAGNDHIAARDKLLNLLHQFPSLDEIYRILLFVTSYIEQVLIY